jgi:octaprenyl-diphosphate synthase
VVPLVADRLALFETRLRAELRSDVAFIEAIGDDLVRAGGKRLRPTLAFLAADLVGADPESAMRVALAVEMLHAASLLHDDLIDDAETRRGAAAAFRRYGNVVSVMSGDFMLARVLGLLARSGSSAFTMLMSETAARICEGEVLQFQAATLETHDRDVYRRVIEGKTAVLLAAALEGPALLAGAPEPQRSALRLFGMAYGRAFQMQDDLLDLLGDESELGKPVGGDLRDGKATLPVLELLQAGVEEPREVLRRHAREPGDVGRIAQLVREHGADRNAAAFVVAEAEEAIAALAPFPPSPARDALTALAQREIERTR